MPPRLRSNLKHDLSLLHSIIRPSTTTQQVSPPPHAPTARPRHASASSRPFSILSRPPPSYPGHVPLTSLERAALALGSAATSLLNPRRADMIAALGEATSQPFFITRLRDRMLLSPTGRRILRDRPRITSSTLSLARLRLLPPHTLGATYAAWLDREHVTPDTRDAVRYVDDAECAYVMQRYRESHDFYHAVTGLPVYVEGEVALKAFEFANTGLPMTLLALAAVVRLKPAERERFWGTYLPWAVKNGVRSGDLICVYWEEELETDVEVLRARLGIERPPDLREERKRAREERRLAREARDKVGVEGVAR